MAINTLYLDNAILRKASGIYNSQPQKNIRLEAFFQKSIFSRLQEKLHNADYKLSFNPYKHRYFAAKIKEIDSFIHGRYFLGIAEKILNAKRLKMKYGVVKFGPGCYTLLHDSEKEDAGVDFIIDFSKTGKNYGGYTVYLNEREELLRLNPSPNTLSFIERREGVMKYTKYATHRQKTPLVFVMGTIL